jgi:hypothetical protein
MEEEMKFREFVVRGRVYSPNQSVANHRVYWAIANSEHQDDFLIDEVFVAGNKTKSFSIEASHDLS